MTGWNVGLLPRSGGGIDPAAGLDMLGALSPVFCVSAKKIFLSFISETKQVGWGG